MEKYILLTLFIISNPIFGQEYDLYVEYRYVGGSHPYNSDVSIKLDTVMQFAEYMQSPVSPPMTFTNGGILSTITPRTDINWDAHINFAHKESGTVTLGLNGKSTFMLNDGGRSWSASILLMEKITLEAPSMENLCHKDKITIQASLGHPTVAYNWYYSAPGYSEKALMGNLSSLTISLADLFPDPNDQIQLIDKPILFRLHNSLNDYSAYTTYIWKGCSPELIDSDAIVTSNETCHGSNDGGVTLTFKENIAPGSKMRFFVYNGPLPTNTSPEDLIGENPQFPGTERQTILDPLIDLVPTANGYSGSLNGLSGSQMDPDGTVNNFTDYFIVYQEVDYRVSPPVVKSGGITPTSFRIERPAPIILDTSAPDFFIDAVCFKPAIFNLNNTALGGNNLIPGGHYSYEYSLDNGLNWNEITAPDSVLTVEPTSYVQSVQLRGIYTASGNRCSGEVYSYPISAFVEPVTFGNPSTGPTSTAGAVDGYARVEFSGGTAPYSYSISKLNTDTNTFDSIAADPFTINIPDGTAVSFNGLPAGIFQITVTDSNNCIQISSDLTIDTDSVPLLGIPIVVQMDCMGNNGTIDVPVSRFNVDYRYQWIHNGTAFPIQNGIDSIIRLNKISVAGTYVLRISAGRVSDQDFEDDTNVTSTSIQIMERPTVNITDAIPNGTTCSDSNDGSILLTVSGGTSYEYSLQSFHSETDWLPLNGTSITGLAPGSYRIKIRNEFGCESNPLEDLIISRPPKLESTAIKTDVIINGGDQGSIVLEIIGGTPFPEPRTPYKIAWQRDGLAYMDNDISEPQFIDGLTAGSYKATITDANGCNSIITVLISQPEALVATIGQTLTIDCYGDDYGEITAWVQGGLPPYTYEWYRTVSNNNILLLEDTEIIGGLTSGTYFLKLTDSNNIRVDLAPLTISQPEPLVAQVGRITNVSCMGQASGAISINVSGGTAPYSYIWSNGATGRDLIDVEAGDYTVEVMDANACFIEVTATIDSPSDLIQIVDAAIEHTSGYQVEDGSISLTISGGTAPYSFNWERLSDNSDMGDQNTILNLSADRYRVIVSDAKGCATSEIYEIGRPDIVVETIVPPSCWDSSDGSITILVNQGQGNYAFNWDNGENTDTITGLTPGNYTVTIDGFGDGPLTRTYKVEGPQPLLIDIEKKRTICRGQKLILDASIEDDSATYSWTSDIGFSSDRPNITVDTMGNYTITVTSGNGCIATATVFVNRRDYDINAEFAMASQVFVGESLIAVDISYPIPESLEWILPEAATLIKQDSDEAEFLFDEAGEYEVQILTKTGNCTAQRTKKVLVMIKDSATIGGENKITLSHIQNFILHPNPTTGKFVADIVLPETGTIGIKIFSFANNALMVRQKASGASSYSVPLDLSGLPAGIYAVVLETPFGNALRKVILN